MIGRRGWLLGTGAVALGSSPVAAAGGMVACADPQAAAAGAAMLAQGGSAADAAVAAALALSVVEPHASGLGGGGTALLWTQATRSAVALDGLAAAPAVVPGSFRTAPDGSRIASAEIEGEGREVAVPGAPHLLDTIWRRAGRLPWARLAGPAIGLAESGFYASASLVAAIRLKPSLQDSPPFRAVFLPDGLVPATGAKLRNLDQAQVLRQFASGGPALLMEGAFGTALLQAAATRRWPGLIRAADLAAYRTLQRTVRSFNVFGMQCLTSSPPTGGGITALQILALLERWGAGSLDPLSSAGAHRMIEAARLCAADASVWMGDPLFGPVRDAGMLDPGYLESRSRLLLPTRALGSYAAGNPPAPVAAARAAGSTAWTRTGTSHISAIDAAGNAVSLTMTVNRSWGSGLMARGIVLNNAMGNFADRPAPHPNRLEPNKRPATTMGPMLVLNAASDLQLVVGSAGGSRIIDAIVRTVAGSLAWNRTPGQAVSLPHVGGAASVAELELGTSAAGLAEALRSMGHAPSVVPMNTGTHLISKRNGSLVGAADPRRSGAAVPG